MVASLQSDTASKILGPNGQPLRRGRPGRRRDSVDSYVDVSWTTNQNGEHWSFATGGDANVVYNRERRRTSRNRARYETTNNCVLRGFIDLRTDDTIGDGPTLQMMMEEHEEIEREWQAWSDEVNLAEKLDIIWDAKQQDGEGMALLVEDSRLDSAVPLNLVNFESEQMGNPFMSADTLGMYDGIRHTNGIPESYFVYDFHPDTVRAVPATYTGEWYQPWRVIHLFKKRRPGQLRGLSELVPALPLAAIHRRYTTATLGAAEEAASMAFWLESDASPDDPNIEIGDPYEIVPFVRNQMVTMPYAYKVHQTKGDQPTTGYDTFDQAITIQMGRALKLPAALSYSSKEHNMASGRLEFQTYIRGIKKDRRIYLDRDALSKIFLAWMRWYLAEQSGMSVSDIDDAFIRQNYPHKWSYRPINHSDPEKQAKADATKLESGLMSDEQYLYEQDIRPREHWDSWQRSVDARTEIGLPIPGVQPGMQGLPGDTNDDTEQDGTETTAEGSASFIADSSF